MKKINENQQKNLKKINENQKKKKINNITKNFFFFLMT